MVQDEEKRYHIRIGYVISLLLILLFGGAFIYKDIEGWRYVDALYFSAATMTTVGYGDFTPQTDRGKLFTIAFVFVSVGIALYGLTLIAAHVIEKREQAWTRRIANNKIAKTAMALHGKLKKIFK